MNRNPFNSSDADRRYIWEMLVERDIEAFVRKDWSIVENDFIETGFMGIDAGNFENPDAWKLSYPDLNSYKKEWIKQAEEYMSDEWMPGPADALHRITRLRDIEINGTAAIAHKKFFGSLKSKSGNDTLTEWQTLYHCRKINGIWKIAGFTGYMPHYRSAGYPAPAKLISLPPEAKQHSTAGPYSPVLTVNPDKLVVISGQAAIDKDGQETGGTIEQQTAYTMENCRRQLESAACGMENVFKVNVFLKNLEDWPRFNEVYKTYFPALLPVRTAVQTGLLGNLLVEIEMWAAT